MDGSRAAPSNESDAPESGPRLERVDCARSGPSREKLRTGQLDAAHDIRLEQFPGRCRRLADIAGRKRGGRK